MMNKKLLKQAKTEFGNWREGAAAGEFGVDDLIDICDNLLLDFGNVAFNEIEMALQSFVDDNILEEEEMQYISLQLQKMVAA